MKGWMAMVEARESFGCSRLLVCDENATPQHECLPSYKQQTLRVLRRRFLETIGACEQSFHLGDAASDS
jgi:hypothetical protein